MNTELLNVTATTDENWDTRLEVTVPAAEIDRLYKDAERVFQNRAKVPGFRPGKVPANLVRKRFKGELEQEVRRQVIGEGLPAAIQKENLKPLQMPRLDTATVGDVVRGEDWSFAARFDIHPTFELPAKESVELYKLEEEIPEDHVDGIVDQLRESSRNYDKSEDGEAAAGDMLKVTYKGTIADIEGEDVPSTAERLIAAEDTWVLLSDPEVLPGIAEGLAGVKAGDEKTLTITFGDDFHDPFLVGKTGEYVVTIHEVHKSVLPEMTDEFAARYGAENVEGLREMVRERIRGEQRQGHMQVWRSQLEKWMVDAATFALPAVTLKAETDMLVPQILRQRVMDEAEKGEGEDGHVHGPDCNHDHEHGEDCNHDEKHGDDCDHDHEHGEDCNHDAEEGEHKVDPKTQKMLDEVKEEAAQTAVLRLKLRIVRDALAQQEDLSVSNEEIQQEMYGFMSESKISPEELEQRYDVDKLSTALAEDLLTRKLLDRLMETATFVEPPAKEEASEEEAEPAAAEA